MMQVIIKSGPERDATCQQNVVPELEAFATEGAE